jgi:hypothetical protein
MRSTRAFAYVAVLHVGRATVGLVAVLLTSCSFVQRSYWDAEVERMCHADGGVTVFERVKLTGDEYKQLAGAGGAVTVRRKQTAAPNAPYVAENKTTSLNENPAVYRSETSIVRRSDGKVLSQVVHYARVGTELSPPYGCREVGIPLDVERQTFDTTGG